MSKRGDNDGSFILGMLAGSFVGAGLGMLFAPRAGSETRNQLSDRAERLRSTAADMYGQAADKVGALVDTGREAYYESREPAGEASPSWSGSSKGATGDTHGSGGGPFSRAMDSTNRT
jgi:gas vesicle protein